MYCPTGVHHLKLRTNEKFLATVFKSRGENCGFAYPAGYCLDPINTDYTPPILPTPTTTKDMMTSESITTAKLTTTIEPVTTASPTLPEGRIFLSDK